MNKHTTTVLLYIQNKASSEELDAFKQAIDDAEFYKSIGVNLIPRSILTKIIDKDLLGAVKEYKHLTGAGLKEAKDYVVFIKDAIEARNKSKISQSLALHPQTGTSVPFDPRTVLRTSSTTSGYTQFVDPDVIDKAMGIVDMDHGIPF